MSDVCDNRIRYIRQCEFLRQLEWLGVVELMGNPCSKKQLYRRRVLFHLPKLQRLDKSKVTPGEYIEAANLYGVEEGDVPTRAEIYSRHYPNDVFEVHGPFFLDDEQELTPEQPWRHTIGETTSRPRTRASLQEMLVKSSLGTSRHRRVI